MLKPATLVLVGLASAAAIAHAFRAPFPGPGGNPVLDLIAYHDPGFHTVIRVWYYVAPAVAVVLFGSLGLSVWRVWLQPRAGGGRRGTLPPWPASPEDEVPSLVIGELHHPVVPRESERPSWLVVPETGLYTGVLIVGAVGSGKTSACMYPFAQQLLSWQADRPGRRASALVLEVKGEAGRRITEPTAGPLFADHAADGDEASGTIYVLRSKSDLPFISEHRDLIHKIGVTIGGVQERIGGARHDPTFLMAEVEEVATYRLYNIDRSKLEHLIHRVFASARLEIEIKDCLGNPVVPREWFLVPLSVIDDAVEKIREGTITRYAFDANTASLIS